MWIIDLWSIFLCQHCIASIFAVKIMIVISGKRAPSWTSWVRMVQHNTFYLVLMHSPGLCTLIGTFLTSKSVECKNEKKRQVFAPYCDSYGCCQRHNNTKLQSKCKLAISKAVVKQHSVCFCLDSPELSQAAFKTTILSQKKQTNNCFVNWGSLTLLIVTSLSCRCVGVN